MPPGYVLCFLILNILLLLVFYLKKSKKVLYILAAYIFSFISIMLFAVIEYKLFQFSLFDNSKAIANIYLKSINTFAILLLYSNRTSLNEVFYVFSKLRLPYLVVFMCSVIFLFVSRIMQMVFNYYNMFKIRVVKKGFWFRLKIFLQLVKSLIINSVDEAESVHNCLVLKRLDEHKIDYEKLYLYEKNFRRKKS